MVQQTVERLQYLCDTLPALLSTIQEDDFSRKPSSEQWSKKEIVGHLIDSAANNHQRFIRVQFEDVPTITYDQNKWNSTSQYNKIPSNHLILFWTLYNRQLIEIMKRIPEPALSRICNVGCDTPVTLQWLITDYIRHLEHHLKQLIDYK